MSDPGYSSPHWHWKCLLGSIFLFAEAGEMPKVGNEEVPPDSLETRDLARYEAELCELLAKCLRSNEPTAGESDIRNRLRRPQDEKGRDQQLQLARVLRCMSWCGGCFSHTLRVGRFAWPAAQGFP